MNDAKKATPAAELERQICSAVEPKNEREWWAHREIARLRDRLAVETLALVETLARAERAEAEVERLRAAGQAALRTLESVHVFVTSKERIHRPSGEEWFEGCVSTLRAALTQGGER